MITTILKGAIALAIATVPVADASTTLPQTIATMVAPPALAAAATVQDAQAPVAAPREQAVKTYRITVTAYSSTPDQTDSTPFETANGTHVRDGIVAANFLPFHTRVRFPDLFGDKVFTVEDRMNARFPTRADIWMAKRSAAWDFGLQRNVTMEVLPPADAQVAVAK